MPQFKTLIVPITSVFPITHDTKGYHLSVPADYGYKAGQFVTVEIGIPQADGALKKAKRSYSIASSPTPHPDLLELCIKLTPGGIFTPWFLQYIKAGDEVTIQGPFGTFMLYDHDKPSAVHLISAGSGVAPVMGLLRDLTARKLEVPIRWISSNKTPADICYREEIHRIAAANPNVSIFETITRPDGTEWGGHTGRLTVDTLREWCVDISTSLFFICGPPEFVDAVIAELRALGIEAKQIRKEKYD
ncbi:hypothetical protein HY641_04785 [Candidatus Woesearchaeota archaeon]|nr:hypothetical protein [Candidatus Woesearchaeota archaeon]